MPVGGLLLPLGLQLHRSADGLDDDVLGAEVGHVDEDLVAVVVVLDPGDAVPAPAADADWPASEGQGGRVGEEAAGAGRVEEGRRLDGGVVLPAEEGGAEAAAAVGAADEAVGLARLLG